jgi:hypothetical protein
MLILTRKETKEMEQPDCLQTDISHDGQHGIEACIWGAERKVKLVLHHKKPTLLKVVNP